MGVRLKFASCGFLSLSVSIANSVFYLNWRKYSFLLSSLCFLYLDLYYAWVCVGLTWMLHKWMREVPESFKKPKNRLMDLGKATAEEKDFLRKCHCFKCMLWEFQSISPVGNQISWHYGVDLEMVWIVKQAKWVKMMVRYDNPATPSISQKSSDASFLVQVSKVGTNDCHNFSTGVVLSRPLIWLYYFLCLMQLGPHWPTLWRPEAFPWSSKMDYSSEMEVKSSVASRGCSLAFDEFDGGGGGCWPSESVA